MSLLLITQSLSPANGQGRYSLSLIKELSKKHSLVILSSEKPLIKLTPKVFLIGNFYSLRRLGLKLISGLIKYNFRSWQEAKRVDLVHFLTDYPNYLVFSLLVWLKRKPFLITAHGTYVHFLKKGWRGFLLRKIYQRADQIICVSKYTQQEIKKIIPSAKTIVIHNGVDFKKWTEGRQVELKPKKEKIILGVGALKPRKGYEISLKAVSLVKKKYPQIRYYLVGDQSDKNHFQKLRKIAQECDLEKNVFFLDKLSDEELSRLYQQCDLFLLTPVNVGEKFEGFGLVYLEAGAFSKPVIGTFNCGAEEAIRNGFNGLLVPQNDIQATAKAILKILKNPALAKELGRNGRILAQEMDWGRVIKRYEEAYSLILNSKLKIQNL